MHLHIDHPYLGASADGLVICSCCGPGLLEIKKCPYSKQDVDPTLVVDSKFYLKQTSTGTKLCPQHDYYMQVQGQLYICNRSYCDFVCWTPKGIHIERINKDPSIFLEIEPKLKLFFLNCILPQVLCVKEKADVYCFCRKGEFGQMIACDNSSCPYKWFHFSCVDIADEPGFVCK